MIALVLGGCSASGGFFELSEVLQEFLKGKQEKFSGCPWKGGSRKRAEYGFGEHGFKHRTQ